MLKTIRMNVIIIIKINEKKLAAEMDMDGDIFTKEPIIEQSVKLVSPEDGSVSYFTEVYDLLTNCKSVNIEKYVE